MDITEYDKLELIPNHPSVSVQELTNQTNRTLLYGYNTDRETIHVYLLDGEIHWYMPGPKDHVVNELWLDAAGLVPPKRTYPELCDYEFCALLMSKGISCNFTSWSSSNPNKVRPFPFAAEVAP